MIFTSFESCNFKYKTWRFRSSLLEVFCRKVIIKNFAKFTGKQQCLRPATLLKKRLWHSCFPVNFAKFLRTPFLQNTSGCCFLRFLFITVFFWCLPYSHFHLSLFSFSASAKFSEILIFFTPWYAHVCVCIRG